MSEERYRPMGTMYRSYSPAPRPDEGGGRLPVTRGQFRFPSAGGHADTPGTSPSNPPALLKNPGGWNRRVVGNPQEGRGVDRSNRGREPKVHSEQWGARARYQFGKFITNAFTSRMQVQAELIPRVGPQAGESRPGFNTPRPALQGPSWRFTGVTDTEVYAQAKQRAAAALAAAKKR